MTKVQVIKSPNGKALKTKLDRVKKGKNKVKVGFPEGGGEYPDGMPIVTVAVWNEFGNAVTPERPFFRLAMADNKAKYRKMTKALAKKVLNGSITKEKALEMLGEEAVADIQDSIVNLTSPPNTEITIALKGSSNPLVDTGLMKQSVTSEVIK